MSTWLNLLPLELSSVSDTDIMEPIPEVRPDDTILGPMSNITKRLYSLGIVLEHESGKYMLDAKYCSSKSETEKLETKAVELSAKSHAIMSIMWIGIRDEYSAWGQSIGVRKGFLVTTHPDEERPSFFNTLGLGGLGL